MRAAVLMPDNTRPVLRIPYARREGTGHRRLACVVQRARVVSEKESRGRTLGESEEDMLADLSNSVPIGTFS